MQDNSTTATPSMRQPPMSVIDRRVRRLVRELNCVPGVATFSSCGGHREPDQAIAQVIESEFFVELSIDEDQQGWAAVRLIVAAIDVMADAMAHYVTDADVLMNVLSLTPWQNGETISWELRGRSGLHPNAVAEWLARHRVEHANGT